jgi:signal transduction histidine kinase
LLEEALERSRSSLGREAWGVTRAQWVLVQTRAGRIEDLDERVEETLEPLRRVGAGLGLSEARLWLAEALLVAGRRAAAEALLSRARVYADEVGHLRLRAWADELLTRFGAGANDEPRADQLGQLLELAMAVVRERDTDRLLDRIARSALELLDAERAFVLLGMVGTMEVAAAVSRDGVEPGRPSTSVVNRALREGKEVIAADISERRDLRDAVSVLTMDLASAMCVPMVEDELTLGAIYVDSRRTSAVEPVRALQLLRTLAGYAAVAVSNVEQLAQVAQRADEAAEVAHDIRSPAASITILAEELLQSLPRGHAARDRAERILQAAGRIQDMASAMLQAERVHRRPLDLSALVQRAVALEEPAARRAGVALELDLEPGLEVDGDVVALSRVVSNLVGNALRHSPKGGAVSIQLSPADGDACLRVRDRGPGIPEGAEERIFQRGVKLGERAGRGMGLAIARRIVEQHDGRILARNLGERGAELMFAIPLLG